MRTLFGAFWRAPLTFNSNTLMYVFVNRISHNLWFLCVLLFFAGSFHLLSRLRKSAAVRFLKYLSPVSYILTGALKSCRINLVGRFFEGNLPLTSSPLRSPEAGTKRIYFWRGKPCGRWVKKCHDRSSYSSFQGGMCHQNKETTLPSNRSKIAARKSFSGCTCWPLLCD